MKSYGNGENGEYEILEEWIRNIFNKSGLKFTTIFEEFIEIPKLFKFFILFKGVDCKINEKNTTIANSSNWNNLKLYCKNQNINFDIDNLPAFFELIKSKNKLDIIKKFWKLIPKDIQEKTPKIENKRLNSDRTNFLFEVKEPERKIVNIKRLDPERLKLFQGTSFISVHIEEFPDIQPAPKINPELIPKIELNPIKEVIIPEFIQIDRISKVDLIEIVKSKIEKEHELINLEIMKKEEETNSIIEDEKILIESFQAAELEFLGLRKKPRRVLRNNK